MTKQQRCSVRTCLSWRNSTMQPRSSSMDKNLSGQLITQTESINIHDIIVTHKRLCCILIKQIHVQMYNTRITVHEAKCQKLYRIIDCCLHQHAKCITCLILSTHSSAWTLYYCSKQSLACWCQSLNGIWWSTTSTCLRMPDCYNCPSRAPRPTCHRCQCDPIMDIDRVPTACINTTLQALVAHHARRVVDARAAACPTRVLG